MRKIYLIVVLIYIIINEAECLFMCLLAFSASPLEKYMFKSFAHFYLFIYFLIF